MLLAARTGRWPLTGLDLSSRCWIRRWFRLRRRRRMAFTRNPFLLALMLCGYFIKHRRNQRISSFLKKRRAKPDGFAYLRLSTIGPGVRGQELPPPKRVGVISRGSALSVGLVFNRPCLPF